MRHTTLFVLLSCLTAPAVIAQTTASQASLPTNARQFRKLKVPGEQVEQNVKRMLEELRWHKSLTGALQAGGRKGRPILWVQALGDLDGFI